MPRLIGLAANRSGQPIHRRSDGLDVLIGRRLRRMAERSVRAHRLDILLRDPDRFCALSSQVGMCLQVMVQFRHRERPRGEHNESEITGDGEELGFHRQGVAQSELIYQPRFDKTELARAHDQQRCNFFQSFVRSAKRSCYR